MDKASGATTLVGDTGFTSSYIGMGAVIDPVSGKMYQTIANDYPIPTGLVETDLATAESKLIAEFAGEEMVSGLYISGGADPEGTEAVPYTNTFDSEESMAGTTILDSNADGSTWKFDSNNSCVKYFAGFRNGGDDWFITVPIRLTKGKAYELSFEAWRMLSFDTERLEVFYGTEPTAEAMTNVAMPTTDILSSFDDHKVYTASIIPEKNAVYYIGFHCVSPAFTTALGIDNLSLEDVSVRVPAAVTDFYVEPAAGGVKEVAITLTAPTVSCEDKELTAISKIELGRNGEVIKTFENPAPGEELSFTDYPEKSGSYEYSAIAYNEYGAGKIDYYTVYCGISFTDDVTGVTLVETETPGEVTLSWDAVTEDFNGAPLTEADVTYTIYAIDGYYLIPLYKDITTTSYTFTALDDPSEQAFVQFAVSSTTEGGESNPTVSAMTAVGAPYQNFRESFADGLPSYNWGVDYSDWADGVSLFTDETVGIPAQDGDNGYIGVMASYIDEWGTIISGKIDIAGMENPALTFYTYNVVGSAPDTNAVLVEISTNGADWDAVFESDVNTICDGAEGWGKVAVDLSSYAGSVFQFRITAIIQAITVTLFDNIKVASVVDNDLTVSVSAPASVECGADYKVGVKVTNDGSLAANGWSVELYADGKKVADKEGTELPSGASVTYFFDCTMSAVATDDVVYTAKVVYAADQDLANNESAAVAVSPEVSTLAGLTDVDGALDNAGNAVLTWTAPDESKFPVDQIVEDFENAESFATEYEGWTFLDLDGGIVGGIRSITIPNLPTGEGPASFFIFDSADPQVANNSTFAAVSGSKYLAAMFNYDASQIDEWAISPLLEGGAQTISFYAKSYSAQYPDELEVYYSEESVNPVDFKLALEKIELPDEWTLITVDLPEGARRFAIRACATDAFMLMVDDIHYSPEGAVCSTTVEGYNIYRDGEKVNAEPVTETSFTDTEAPAGTHTYVVTIVYNKGESAPSNTVVVVTTSIGNISVDAAPVEYFNLQGMRIEGELSTGTYIRRQGASATKVYVK